MNDHPPPQPVKIIRDLEALRIITDPLRMRILSLLDRHPRTVKEVAAALNLPPTRLYYHFNLLEKHGFIRVVETRLVSGIVEKHYQVTARAFDVDRRLLTATGSDSQAGWSSVLASELKALEQDFAHLSAQGLLRAAVEDEKEGLIPIRISRALARMTPDQARQFTQRLRDLIAEFEDQSASEADTPSYTLFIAFYPTPPSVRRGRSGG